MGLLNPDYGPYTGALGILSRLTMIPTWEDALYKALDIASYRLCVNLPQGVQTPQDFSNKATEDAWLSLQDVPVNVFKVAALDVAYNTDRWL